MMKSVLICDTKSHVHKAKCFIKGIVYPKMKAVQNRSKQIFIFVNPHIYEGFDVRDNRE